MSAETTPTSVTSGTSRPLVDQARADEHVDRAVGEGVEDPLRGALALDHVAVEPADAQGREALGDLALEALGAAAEIADAGRVAGRAARWPAARWRRSDGSAGPCPRRGRRAAAGTRGRPARSRSRGRGRRWRAAATVEDEDRALARAAVSRPPSASASWRESSDRLPAASSARRSTTSTRRRHARRRAPAARGGGTRPASARPTLATSGVALPRTTGAPARRPSTMAMSRAW